jgi:hypothetical protein
MQYRATISIIILICAALAIAGCTGTQNTPAGVSGTGSPGTSSGDNLVVSSTDSIPSESGITIDVGEKDYLGNIPVIFQGGKGQIQVKKIDVTLYRSDGQVKTYTIGTKKGDEADLEGTKQTDRVVVYATMNNGQRYKTNDVLSAYRTRQ